MRPMLAAEASGDLLLHLHRPQVALGQVVVEGHARFRHEAQRSLFVANQAVDQVLGRAASEALAAFRRHGFVQIVEVGDLPGGQKRYWYEFSR